MNTNYLSSFQISFTGFNAAQQQQLKTCIAENMHLLTAAETVYENDTTITITICFIKNICDINKMLSEKFKPSNERTICVADFDEFESLLSCVRTGCYACVASSNI